MKPALLTLVAALSAVPQEGGSDMLITVESGKSLAQLREDVPKACAAQKFGVLGVHDLKEKMKEKGVDFAGECLVFEVCNPQKAKQVLEAAPEVSTALPCRISVYRGKDGRIRLATIRPTALIDLYRQAGLKDAAAEVEASLTAILNAAR